MSFSNMHKGMLALGASLLLSGTVSASCGNSPICNTQTYQPAPVASANNLTYSNVSNMTAPGLGPNERLCPTSCDVNVHNPEGGKVLGCYEICKPVAPVVQQPRPQPVVQQYQEHYIRVVRPIIRVPVPVPVPVYQHTVMVPVQTTVQMPVSVQVPMYPSCGYSYPVMNTGYSSGGCQGGY